MGCQSRRSAVHDVSRFVSVFPTANGHTVRRVGHFKQGLYVKWCERQTERRGGKEMKRRGEVILQERAGVGEWATMDWLKPGSPLTGSQGGTMGTGGTESINNEEEWEGKRAQCTARA